MNFLEFLHLNLEKIHKKTNYHSSCRFFIILHIPNSPKLNLGIIIDSQTAMNSIINKRGQHENNK